jgi:hypothetical protein
MLTMEDILTTSMLKQMSVPGYKKSLRLYSTTLRSASIIMKNSYDTLPQFPLKDQMPQQTLMQRSTTG